MSKPKRPVLPIMLDCETLSLDPYAAIIDIALAPIGEFGQGKRWLVTPSSYDCNPNFVRDPETVAFHANNKSGILEDAELTGHSWQRAAMELHAHLHDLTSQYEIHMWSQGKDFDFPRLDHLFAEAGLKTPWKYSHTHCLRDFAKFYPEVKRSWWGNHTAMKDVQAQVKHIKDIAAYSERFYNFLYGIDCTGVSEGE